MNVLKFEGNFVIQDGYIFIGLNEFTKQTSTGTFYTYDEIHCTKGDINYYVNLNESKVHYGELLSECLIIDEIVYVNKQLLEYLYNIKIIYNKDKIKAFVFDGNYGYTEFYEIFSDYSKNIDYEIKSMRKDNKLFLSSINQDNSNIFMGYYTKIYGLKPNTSYEFTLSFTLGTSAKKEEFDLFKNQMENVFVKCGIIRDFPNTYYDEKASLYRLDLDMGIDRFGGTDLHVVSDMSRLSEASEFGTKDIETTLAEETNDKGEVFLIIGTDSDYDGKTEFFLENIILKVEEASFDRDSKNLMDRFMVVRSLTNHNKLGQKEVFFNPSSIEIKSLKGESFREYENLTYHTVFINDQEFYQNTHIHFADLHYKDSKMKCTLINSADLIYVLYHINDDVIYLKQNDEIYELIRNNYYNEGLKGEVVNN